MNEAQFSVTTAYQGTSRCNCHIYWWKSTDKIVVSDIDGTITKSDVLGHVMPIIGRDWAQSGVASLFSKVLKELILNIIHQCRGCTVFDIFISLRIC